MNAEGRIQNREMAPATRAAWLILYAAEFGRSAVGAVSSLD